MPPHNRRRRKPVDQALENLTEEERAKVLRERRGELSLAEAGLVVRTVNTLEGKNYFTINDVLELEAEDLLKIQNFGDKTLKELYDVVVKQNLTPPRSWLARLPKGKKKKP